MFHVFHFDFLKHISVVNNRVLLFLNIMNFTDLNIINFIDLNIKKNGFILQYCSKLLVVIYCNLYNTNFGTYNLK